MTTPGAHKSSRHDALFTALACVCALVLIDAAIGIVARMPNDARKPPSALAFYFDFGTSLEGKLRRLAGPSDSLAAPVAHAGWLDPATWPQPQASGAKRSIAVYGQSFTYAIMDTLAAHDTSVVLRPLGGPSAPPSHLFALWRVDRRRTHADVCVFGVLASSVRGMGSATAATWEFESPYPYTYPHWHVAGDSLTATWPSVTSLPSLRATLADPARLAAWEQELAREDDGYEPLLFRGGELDHSVLVRLLRRAWAQRQMRERLARLHGTAGYAAGTEAMRVLPVMLAEFARGVRADGGVPVVLLLQDQGYDDHLVRALGPALQAAGVPFVSTDVIAPASVPGNFMPDGHFIGPVNQRLAAVVDSLLASVPAGR
jgi:hypothetical protein